MLAEEMNYEGAPLQHVVDYNNRLRALRIDAKNLTLVRQYRERKNKAACAAFFATMG